MILITDSGSTKCDWIAIDDAGKTLFEKIRTKGLNPAILPEKKLNRIISKSKELMQFKSDSRTRRTTLVYTFVEWRAAPVTDWTHILHAIGRTTLYLLLDMQHVNTLHDIQPDNITNT